jgi:hypothetical protein
MSAPHSSVFARLASGAFYETIGLAIFYEIIKKGRGQKDPSFFVYAQLGSRPSPNKPKPVFFLTIDFS